MKTISTNSIPRDILASTFISAYWEDIFKFALCHSDKEGYVHVSVTLDYTLKSIKFIEGLDINKYCVFSKYHNPWPRSDEDIRYYFFEIYFPEINTWYRAGEVYFELNSKRLIPTIYSPN